MTEDLAVVALNSTSSFVYFYPDRYAAQGFLFEEFV